jgi:hypothetical protein
MLKISTFFIGLLAAAALQAAPVYDNTTTDTLGTVVYSSGPYSEIGDQIHLGGTDRLGNSATAQFYNLGVDGTFDATLNFYSVVDSASGVGGLLGSFVASGIALLGGNVGEVSWLLNGLNLPDDLIFTVTLGNLSQGVDLGLTVFDPPTIGTSSGSFLIVNGGSGFAQASTGSGTDNIYFRLDASDPNAIPEPGTGGLLILAALAGFAIRLRRGGVAE